MPERSRAASRGRRSWSMRVTRPGSHPAAGEGAGPGGGRGLKGGAGAGAWSEGAGAFGQG